MTVSCQTPGAVYLGNGRCRFRVWAPQVETVAVHLLSPAERWQELAKDSRGHHSSVIEGVYPGARYLYRLNGAAERPDPASRCQPQGVHGPSQVVDPAFDWQDAAWFGLPLSRYILYELHIGAYTPAGTFEALGDHLDALKALGITALELMPVAQFPGERNWGYDGVYPFAVQHSYGGVQGLKRLVDACHRKGLAVVLDVVYNHLGPEGNYFSDYGPYFAERYQTPWGAPLNFDGPWSDEVRRFFVENALFWITEFHIDALRLDAVHAIFDFSAKPFLQELAEAVRLRSEQNNRRAYLIAESALNDPRLIRSPELGGFGLDAQWNDDFHHSLHALLTGEGRGYYQDFGNFEHLVKAYREGLVYSGQYSVFRRRRHGSTSRPDPAERFVVFAQNHDQVGNRMLGERLGTLLPFDALKLAAGCVLLSPYIPLLFMGEEYGEIAPFPYFISHADEALVKAVREGRRRDFTGFDPAAEPPDPQAEGTFASARLDHTLRHRSPHHRLLYAYYRELIRLRREIDALARLSKEHMEVHADLHHRVLYLRRWSAGDEVLLVLYFDRRGASVTAPIAPGIWQKRLDSNDPSWEGGGTAVPTHLSSSGEAALELNPYACILFSRDK